MSPGASCRWLMVSWMDSASSSARERGKLVWNRLSGLIAANSRCCDAPGRRHPEGPARCQAVDKETI
ncbi:hypothetical protein AAHB37_17760 [Glutamicibacter halophytocola]|uniref:hypothetical protein n=1 Tax=Glutamicibacter halophytocola TaxID=1933880 RepID=UPI00321A25D9